MMKLLGGLERIEKNKPVNNNSSSCRRKTTNRSIAAPSEQQSTSTAHSNGCILSMTYNRRSTLIIHRPEEMVQSLHDKLFEVAIKYVASGHVIFFTRKQIERISESLLNQFSSLFKNIIFFYVQSIDSLVDKLIELQGWENCLPVLIIIESLDSIINDAEGCSLDNNALVMACAADTANVLSSKLQSNCKCITTISDEAYDDFHMEMYVRESYVLDGTHLTGFTDILSVLAEMTYHP